jgi:hypothetical protein
LRYFIYISPSQKSEAPPLPGLEPLDFSWKLF